MFGRLSARIVGSWIIAALALLVSSAAEAQVRHAIDLPAQPLEESLRTIGRITGTNVLFEPQAVKGKTARAVKGELTADEALRQALQDSTLDVTRSNENTIVIRDRASSGGAAQISTQPSQTQSAGASESPWNLAMKGETIEVTGSRLKRSDIEGPSPIHIITRSDIERMGASTVRDVLAALPQNGVTFDESGTALAGVQVVQLRGLKRGATLILLNGRPLSVSGIPQDTFDISNIPLSAVERIEVLTDSAAAVYGANAIAGAVNFILRKNVEVTTVGVRFGTSYAHDATERMANAATGWTSGKASGVVAYEHFEREPAFLSDRSLTADKDFRRVGGPDLRSNSSYPGNVYAIPGRGNLPGLSRTLAGIPAGTGIGLTPADFIATAGVQNKFSDSAFVDFVTKSRRDGVLATANYAVSSRLDLFAELLHSRYGATQYFAPDQLTGGSAGTFRAPATNPFNPFGTEVGIDYRFVELGSRQFVADSHFTRLVAGARGPVLRDMEWELSVAGDYDKGTMRRANQIDAAAVRRALADTNPATALNVFSSALNNNRATLAGLLGETTDDGYVKGVLAQAIVRGPIATVPAGDVQVAAGVEARREQAKLDAIVSGAQSGFPEVTRNVKAVFGEVRLPFVNAAMRVPAAQSVEVTVAARVDDYNDFGTSRNPQIGLTWRPISQLMLRASGGTAFRPPTLRVINQVPGVTIVTTTDPLRGNEVVSVPFTTGGTPTGLLPEESKSRSLGIVWEPPFVPGLSFTADYYRIRVDQNIGSIGIATLLLNADLFPGRVVRADPTPADVAAGRPGRLVSVLFTQLNFGFVDTRGVDVTLDYHVPPTRFGIFLVSCNASYVDRFDVALTPGAPPSNEVSRSSGPGTPVRFRTTATLSWDSTERTFGASVVGRYLGRYVDVTNRSLQLGRDWFVDVQGRIALSRLSPWLAHTLLTAGVINANNNQPSFSNLSNGYDPQRADLRGRFYYVGLQKEFR